MKDNKYMIVSQSMDASDVISAMLLSEMSIEKIADVAYYLRSMPKTVKVTVYIESMKGEN